MYQPRLIFKNVLAQTIANLITRFSNIVITFVMARTLSATGIGIYSTAFAYFSVFDEATNMGASTYLIREIAKDPAETGRFVVNFSILGGVLALFGTAVFWMILPYLQYSRDLVLSLALIALGLLPGTFISVLQSVFVARQRMEFVTYTTLVTSVLTILLSLYFLLSGYGVVVLVAVFVLFYYFQAILYFFFVGRYITPLHFKPELAFMKKILSEIKAFFMLSVLGALLAQPELIVLSLMVSEEQVGYYSAAAKVALLWLFISHIFMNNIYPVLSRSHQRDEVTFQSIQDKSVKYLLAISLPITAGTIAAAAPIILLLFGTGFGASILPLQILVLGIPVTFISSVLWRSMTARNLQNELLLVRVFNLVSRIGLAVAFIYWWNVNGAAIAASLNLWLAMLLLGWFLNRSGVQSHIMKLGWRFGLASAVMGIVVWVLRDKLNLLILVLFAAVIYLVLVLALRAFSTDDLALFRQIWRPKAAISTNK